VTKDDIIRMAREAGFADGVAEIVGLEGFANYFADNKKALEAALEQQQAEPVAWQYKTVEAGVFVSDQHPPDVKVWNDIEWSKPLYTTPPAAQPEQVDCPRCGHVCSQRPWVGLTEEDVKHEWEVWRASLPRYIGFAQGIEAKLKERNT
jgi:hypothetical protein